MNFPADHAVARKPVAIRRVGWRISPQSAIMHMADGRNRPCQRPRITLVYLSVFISILVHCLKYTCLCISVYLLVITSILIVDDVYT
jgi:hypothetical protein